MPRLSHPDGGSSRKKFGKNLNKLVKPVEAPPIARGPTGQSRNGLLLLSATKKSEASGLLASKTSTSTKGCVSAAHFDACNTSDGLVSSAGGSEKQQQPDAWGVSEKKYAVDSVDAVSSEEEGRFPQVDDIDYPNGGGDNGLGQQADEDQVSFMSRLAKERTEKRLKEEEERLQHQKERAAARLRELEGKTFERSNQNPVPRALVKRSLWEEDRLSADENKHYDPNPASPVMTRNQPEYSGPVIHLTSYEDRDRGESSKGSAPRLLFDPKSGSMVEVKSREEQANRRKERVKKKKDTLPRRENGVDDIKIARKPDVRKEGSTISEYSSKDSTVIPCNPITPEKRNRLPRTCGVLYAREENGEFYCVDGCDGDLGYGAHSVRGGKMRNSDAYAEFIKNNEIVQHDYYDDYAMYGSGEGNSDVNVELYTGFNPDDHDPIQEPLELVKAGDKLELVTGLDDSPTLKPTAREWAPSQAALAALAAAAQNRGLDAATNSEEEEERERIGEEDNSFGLGFDPTHDMDGLMQSPLHHSSETDLKIVSTFEALALEPTIFANENAETERPRHIFAFGSSGTWGIHKSNDDVGDDWESSLIGRSLGLFGPEPFRSNDTSSPGATSFISIPPGSSWGLEGIQPNGDATHTMGD